MAMDTENSAVEQTPETTTSDMPTSCQLNLSLIDVIGNPIKGLNYRIEIDGKPYLGVTDDQGNALELTDLPFGAIAQIYVKRLDGTYKFIGETALNSIEINICAVSPKVLIEVDTLPHDGEPGQVDADIEKIEDSLEATKQNAAEAIKEANFAMAEAVNSPVETPKKADLESINNNSTKASASPIKSEPTPISTGGRPPITNTQVMRDQKGLPHALVKEIPKNWFNKHFSGAFYIWGIADFLKPAPVPSQIQPKTKGEIKESRKESTIDKSDHSKKNKHNTNNSNIYPSLIIKSSTVAPSTKATVPVPVTADNLQQLQQLFEFAEKQAHWKYPFKSTAAIANLFTQAKGSWLEYMDSESKKGERYVKDHTKANPTANGLCYPYVKIALWHSGITSGLLGGECPGTEAGDELIKFGFRDVTAELPDVRWAAPGDVITYQWTDETWEKRKDNKHFKTKEARDAYPNYGHIEIRTYDSYISDGIIDHYQFGTYKNISIYRKIYDPLPEKRMRAFLKVLASREAGTVFERDGYQESYRALPGKPFGRKFTDFKTHPFAGRAGGASGAYGIQAPTWENYLKFLDLPDGQDQFSPIVQDRIAITIMEKTKNVLALIRRGEIESAAHILATTKQWTSLPGGIEDNQFTVSDMISSYNQFLEGLK